MKRILLKKYCRNLLTFSLKFSGDVYTVHNMQWKFWKICFTRQWCPSLRVQGSGSSFTLLLVLFSSLTLSSLERWHTDISISFVCSNAYWFSFSQFHWVPSPHITPSPLQPYSSLWLGAFFLRSQSRRGQGYSNGLEIFYHSYILKNWS